MGTQRSSFAKRERDRAKKAKAAAKREARLEKSPDDETEEDVSPDVPQESAEVLMDKLAKLHERFDDGGMDFDDFEEQKAELMARMPIE